MGEFAWDVIKSMGGWQEFCRLNAEAENHTAVYAQLRDLIKAKMGKAKRGHTEQIKTQDLLPNRVQSLLQNVTKQISKDG